MTLDREQINNIFADADHQAGYVIDLFRAVIPEFDQCQAVDGFVHCGKVVGELLMQKAIVWDQDHSAGTMPGGAWMQYGFSVDESLGDWEIVVPKITMEQIN